MNVELDPLEALLLERIEAAPNQRISFVKFMDLALYHPQWGYYCNRAAQMGRRGDFVTAVHLGADFGELLATQLLECWQILEFPQPFTLLEMGAGQGLLAQQILDYIQRIAPDCYAALQYGIVERSATLKLIQQQRLTPHPVTWLTWDEIPADSIVGCCFSNELVDAFPVHLVEVQSGQLSEVYVTAAPQPEAILAEVLGEPSTPELAQYFQDLQLEMTAYESGYRTEVNLAARGWMELVCDRIHRGYLITIDYGYPAHRYYSPSRRQGTLQCYSQHAHHSDPYYKIGQQDITAHVNFTALEQWGSALGLDKIGFIEQGLFLMSLGLGERIAALSDETGIDSSLDLQKRLQRRQFLHSLIDPAGMGNFGVLIQGKGLTTAQQNHPLKSLTTPPWP